MKNKRYLYLLSILLTILLLSVYFFVITFTVNGRVIDKYTKKPLANIEIPLTFRKIKTDKDGNFSISLARRGYSFKIFKKNYETNSISINSSRKIVIKLRPTTLTGKVLDVYSGQPIENALVATGKQKTKSNYKGSYKLSNVPEKINLTVQVFDKKYEVLETKITGTTKKDLLINLKPHEALAYINSLVQAKQFDEEYNLLHSDIKKMVSKNQAIQLWENDSKEIEDLLYSFRFQVGNYKILNEWFLDTTNKSYDNVAEIQQTKISTHVFGDMSNTRAVHLIKDNGRWTWVLTKEAVQKAKKIKLEI